MSQYKISNVEFVGADGDGERWRGLVGGVPTDVVLSAYDILHYDTPNSRAAVIVSRLRAAATQTAIDNLIATATLTAEAPAKALDVA